MRFWGLQGEYLLGCEIGNNRTERMQKERDFNDLVQVQYEIMTWHP